VNELLLVEMMSELSPELLQNEYIEKDMKREKAPFLNRFFSFIKNSKPQFKISFENILSEETTNQYGIRKDELEEKHIQAIDKSEETRNIEEANIIEDIEDDNLENLGFTISIFRKKIRNFIKIISSIAATFLVVIGIVIFIIKHNKSGLKLYEKKVQVIF